MLAASLRFAELHPDRKILITGHTDTSGGDEYNHNLSEFRAAAVHAVLTNGSGSREDFGDIAHGPHLQGKEKKQQVLYNDRVQVLNWVAATFGWSCATSGEYGDYLRAVKSFQRTFNEEGNDGAPTEQLDVDGDFGPATWRAVFDCYQMRLAETLEIQADELRSLQDEVGGRFVADAPFAGCGENKPRDRVGVTANPCAEATKLDALMGGSEAAGAALYGLVSSEYRNGKIFERSTPDYMRVFEDPANKGLTTLNDP